MPFNGSLFLQTEKGYLIESIIRSKCSAVNGSLFFLALIKRVEHDRHIILFDNNGTISSYDRSLTVFLDLQTIKKMQIQEIFNFRVFDLEDDTMYRRNYKEKSIWIVKSFRKFKGTIMNVLLIYEDEENMKTWEKQCGGVIHELEEEEENRIREVKIPAKVEFADDQIDAVKTRDVVENRTINEESLNREYKEEKKDKSSFSSISTSNINDQISRKHLIQALRGIKLYKWILFLFVKDI